MQATFFTVDKRVNSTKQGTGGASYSVTLKEDCSIIAPRLALIWPGSGNPCAYNGCYIPDFGRYYWVTDWTYSDRQWVASCSVDVLATAKTEIGNSQKYILRSASEYDAAVLDMKYPAKMSYKTAKTLVTNPYGSNMSNGVYIVSISGQGASGIQYIQMDAANFETMISETYINSQQIWQSLQSSSVEDAIKNYGLATYTTAANPFQYINSVMWFPKAFSSVPYGYVQLGPVQTSAAATRPTRPNAEITVSFPVPSIPVVEQWQKAAPYRTYSIFLPPFGLIDLDATICSRISTINASIVYDYISGSATCTFYGLADSELGYEAINICKVSGQIGIPVATASRMVDNLGAVTSANLNFVGAAAGGVTSLLAGNIGGVINAAASAVGSIESAARANAGYVQQKGVSGGVQYLEQTCYIQVIQYDAPDRSPAEFGRPLMKVRAINTIRGFVLCADGEVEAELTRGELDQIAAFLTGGIFYE